MSETDQAAVVADTILYLQAEVDRLRADLAERDGRIAAALAIMQERPYQGRTGRGWAGAG